MVTVTLYGADETLLSDIWAMCDRYERLLSKTIQGSDVMRINSAEGESVSIDAETMTVLRTARTIHDASGGAFSITLAPIVAMWDFTHGT